MYYHDTESCYSIILGRAESGYSLLRLNCWQLLSSLTAEDSIVKTYPPLREMRLFPPKALNEDLGREPIQNKTSLGRKSQEIKD